jgi:hypothetical protein
VQVREIDAWWRGHRQAAPSLFIDELEHALLAPQQNLGPGIPYAPNPEPEVRFSALKGRPLSREDQCHSLSASGVELVVFRCSSRHSRRVALKMTSLQAPMVRRKPTWVVTGRVRRTFSPPDLRASR